VKVDRTFCSGSGWRLGYKSTALLYPALIGTDEWAIELSSAELADFCRLLYQLADNMQQMQSELMVEEKIDCEVETELLWMQVSGLPSSYSLRLLLHSDRKVEGNWPAAVLPEMIEATKEIFPYGVVF
jgi:Domain of unknown function (DUF1818)